MSSSDRSIEDLAAAIADGTPIQWSGDAENISARQRSVLTLLEKVSRVHSEPIIETQSASIHRWGSLLIEEEIGSGASSIVYRAFDPMLERHVALKLTRDDAPDTAIDRWLQEARRMALVKHANVITIYGAEKIDGRGGIWSELLLGSSLLESVNEDGPLSAREAATIGIDVCHALRALHAAGLIHGDVKPANIFRETGGRIVLLDLGSSLDRTATHATSGSPALLAPEALIPDRPTTAFDIYALGASLYFLVSGEYPIDALSALAAKRVHENSGILPLAERRPDLPADFVEYIDRAIDTDPANRFNSTSELERALHRFLTGKRVISRRAASILAIVAACLIGIIGVGLWTASSSPENMDPLLATTQLESVNASGTTRILANGSSVSVGEKLRLRVRTEKDTRLYVINTDQNGAAFLLFPIPGMDLVNPLRGHKDYVLPGPRDGIALDWLVTSRGTQERMVIIASGAPLPALEQELLNWVTAGSENTASIAIPLRGIGGLAAGSSTSSTNTALDALLSDLYSLPDVEIRSFILNND